MQMEVITISRRRRRVNITDKVNAQIDFCREVDHMASASERARV